MDVVLTCRLLPEPSTIPCHTQLSVASRPLIWLLRLSDSAFVFIVIQDNRNKLLLLYFEKWILAHKCLLARSSSHSCSQYLKAQICGYGAGSVGKVLGAQA